MKLPDLNTPADISGELGSLVQLMREEYPDMSGDADAYVIGEIVARLENAQKRLSEIVPTGTE